MIRFQLVLLFLFSSIYSMASQFPAEHYLANKIPEKNHRYTTFKRALEIMEQRKIHTIVETGTSRGGDQNFDGDGGSTIIFSQWACDQGAEFYSVDINSNNLSAARNAVKKYIGMDVEKIQFVCSDSISFLSKFNKQIDFLYLDSFDFEFNNPNPSQMHHLYEIQAAYPFLTENSVVMIDDCNLPHGGKGKFVIEFLLGKGWKIIEKGYQVILVYGNY